MDEFPGRVQQAIGDLVFFFRPQLNPWSSNIFSDYEWLSNRFASLMCLSYLSSESYVYHEAEIPPRMLQLDLQGAICFKDDRIVIEGGEVKSSSKGEPTPLHIKCCY